MSHLLLLCLWIKGIPCWIELDQLVYQNPARQKALQDRVVLSFEPQSLKMLVRLC